MGVSPDTPLPAPAPLRPRTLAVLIVAATLLLVPSLLAVRGLAHSVSQYHADAFEGYARDAMARGDYAAALRFASGALQTELSRDAHHGRAHLVRALALAKLGRAEDALAALETADAFFTARYYYAEEGDRREGADLGSALADAWLQQGDTARALRAYSVAARLSGDAVDYLHALAAALTPEAKAGLWGGTAPYIVLREFVARELDAPAPLTNEQNRPVNETGIDATIFRDGPSSAFIDVGASQGAGRSWFAVPAYLQLPERPFGLRTVLRDPAGIVEGLLVRLWYEQAQQSSGANGGTAEPLGDDWQVYAWAQDLYASEQAAANAKGYPIDDGIVNYLGIALKPGAAGKVWLDRVELYLSE